MNYCTKCQSLYAQPGTCNCFAPQNVRTYYSAGPVHFQCPICRKWDCTETHITVNAAPDIAFTSALTNAARQVWQRGGAGWTA